MSISRNGLKRITSRHWRSALIVFGVGVIPFTVQPFRLEFHETQRIGLLALLAVMIVLTCRTWYRSVPSSAMPILAALVLWTAALALSSLFSLSPARSIMGDLMRRMGLVGQLALMAAFLLGCSFHIERDWRWFWRAGVVVAVYVLLEAGGLLWPAADNGRPRGPFGSATFTGEWLSLICVWVGAMVLTIPFRRRLYRSTAAVTWLLMVAALVATGSRGALFAAFAGAITAVLGLAVANRSRWLALILPAVTLLVLLASVVAGIVLARSGYLSRFTAQAINGAFAFRTALWTDVETILHDWPVLPTVQGGSDRWSGLRPLVGYGPEMFEAPERLTLSTQTGVFTLGQRVDRAHNVWLDDAVTLGLLGLVAQFSIWAAAWWVGLRRAGIAPLAIVVVPALSGLLGWRIALGTPYLALVTTLSGLLGIWLLLLVYRLTRHAAPDSFDRRTIIALAVLTTHIVALQFSFISAATEWPAWLALGLLISARPADAPAAPARDDTDSVNAWSWLAVGGMFLLRFLLAWQAQSLAIAILIVTAAAAAWVGTPWNTRGLLTVAVCWVFGAVGAFVQAPWLAAGWDVAAFVLAFACLTQTTTEQESSRVPGEWAGLAAVAVVLVLFGRDIAADIQLRQSTQPGIGVTQALAAQQLRPWDDRTVASAGKVVLDAALNDRGDTRLTGLQLAQALFLRAGELNPVEPDYALEQAIIHANLALPSRDRAQIEAAQTYFDRAIRLWPGEAVLWRERGRFALTVLNDPAQAKIDLQHALDIDPWDNETYSLLDPINGIIDRP